MAKVNGKEVVIAAEMTVEKYLSEAGYPLSRIALEYNGRILPKQQYSSTVIRETDVIEIVSFVGGG